jgi:hypothetical protein
VIGDPASLDRAAEARKRAWRDTLAATDRCVARIAADGDPRLAELLERASVEPPNVNASVLELAGLAIVAAALLASAVWATA